MHVEELNSERLSYPRPIPQHTDGFQVSSCVPHPFCAVPNIAESIDRSRLAKYFNSSASFLIFPGVVFLFNTYSLRPDGDYGILWWIN